MFKFHEADLDMYICTADAQSRERTTLIMTPETFDFLVAHTVDAVYLTVENEKLYKGHPIVIDASLRSSRVIKMSTPKEDLYYSWYIGG